MVSVECTVFVTSWQCSVGDTLYMVCKVWNITQVEARCCHHAGFRVHGAFDILLIHG